jgi:hypothetical protein
MEILENQIRLQYKVFGHETYWTQLHAQDPKENKFVSRELVKGVDAVIDWARTFNGKGNLYLGRAARDDKGTPIRTSVFTLDVDPVRPKGTASSAEGHAKVLRAGRQILGVLGKGYLCSSGNGALIIVPFDQPITEGLLDFSEKTKQFESQLRDVFQTGEINVDATQDAARLCRLLGTWNVKGEPGQWRIAHVVSKSLFRTKRPGVRETIEAIQTFYPFRASVESRGQIPLETRTSAVSTGQHAAAIPTYDHSVYSTREKAEWALAMRLKLAGFGPDDIRKQLAEYGYMQNPRDAERVISKIFANERRSPNIQRGLSVGLETVPPEPLWTPLSGLSNVQHQGESEIGTGFRFLDDMLGGVRPGYVYAIEAPTNVGKSTCITQIANHLARCGKRVLLVITEMDVREAVTRIKAISTGVSGHQLEAGILSEAQRTSVKHFEERFAKYQLFIRYTTSPSQAFIEEDIKAAKAEVVLWDYYQHFETGNESRQVQLGSLARWFESTALKYHIPFIVAAQLHRRKDFKNKKLMPASMDDLKDCKVLNDAAKVVVVLDWDHAADTSGEAPVPVHFRIQKNKGPMGEGVLRLVRNIPRFEDL